MLSPPLFLEVDVKQRAEGVRWGERGSFALLAGLTLVLMLGFAALVIDVGYLYWSKTRAQTAAEAAALAAVKELDQTPAGLAAACLVASEVVASNDPEGELDFRASCLSPNAAGDEIRFGVWDGSEFTESQEALLINAVQIEVGRTREKGNAAPPLLSGVFALLGGARITGLDVRASAVAIVPPIPATGAGSTLPLAISSCSMMDEAGGLACGREVIVGSAAAPCTLNPDDCVRDGVHAHFTWTLGQNNTESINASSVRSSAEQFVACHQGSAADCAALPALGVGDLIATKSNESVQGALGSSSLPGYIQQLAMQGRRIIAQVPIYGASSCSLLKPGSITGRQVVGLASVEIDELHIDNGSDNDYIRVRIVCDVLVDEPGDPTLPDYGTVGTGPAALVD
jgi:hypothetical protein